MRIGRWLLVLAAIAVAVGLRTAGCAAEADAAQSAVGAVPAPQETPTPDQGSAPQEQTAAPEQTAPTQSGTSETSRRWRLSNWRTDGLLDYWLMYMHDPEMKNVTGQLMSAELNTTATISNGERDVLDLALQWPYATQMRGVGGRGREMHFGLMYGIYKFGLSKPSIRFGQFVVPFGNLTYYETHSFPLQTLYAQSLGIRIDRGVSLEGIRGEYDYWLALVGGNGALPDNNNSPAVVARLARRYDLSQGTLTAGASFLYGTEMPRFSTLVDPVMGQAMQPMGMAEMPSLDFTKKVRVGLDGEYSVGEDIWRAELVGGSDSDGSVNGEYLQWNRALSARREVTAQVARWEQPGGRRLRFGGVIAFKLDQNSTIRLAAERSLGRTPAEHANETMILVELLREFPRVLAGR